MSTVSLNTTHLFPICEIMLKMSTNERLTIRIDRGQKPSITFNSSTQVVQIHVPLDTTVNHQPVSQNIGNGYVLKLQRMQQQYKIGMQCAHERKPEFVVFASNLAHGKQIKTIVKEVNTTIPDLIIAGSNLEVCGTLKGHNLTFESTVGTMHVYAKISCTGSLSVHSQNIVISTEALLSTDSFKAICRKLQNDGRIFPCTEPATVSSAEAQQKIMKIDMSCNLVHIGVDGCLGGFKGTQATHLQITVAGDLANYGKIQAKESIFMEIFGNHMSLQDGSLDSAGRGYNALKKLRKVAENSISTPSSSTMHHAIQNQNASAVANMIENGIDLNDIVGRQQSRKVTLKQSAITEYKEAREKSKMNSVRERITLINALFVAHEWRRGSVQANHITAKIHRNCDDLAQFSAKNLKMKVGGSATVENDSIWCSTWVELEVKQNVYFHGQSKTRTMILHSDATIFTTDEAILSVEVFARVECVKFDCEGMWCAGESLVIETLGSAFFNKGAYVESEKLELDVKGACEMDATWQLTSAWCHVSANFTFLQNTKIFIEQSITVSALSLFFSGFCHVNEMFDLVLQDSAHFFGNSKMEIHVLRLTCKGYCTIGGSLSITDLSAYVRNELITTSTGKMVVIGCGDVISGCFRNDALWQVEKNLKITSGSIEQSEDGTIFVKYTMHIVLHEDSREHFGGRLISSEIVLKSLKNCVFHGLIRCNEMQISLPYVSESMVTLKGQTDIVAGCLTVNGNLTVDDEHFKSPVTPGLIIGSALTAAAVVAPFASVHLTETAVVRLNGIESRNSEEFNVLLNCGALYTEKESVIFSMANGNSMSKNEQREKRKTPIKREGIIVATTLFHRGQIRFSGLEVNILAPIFIHEGRLSNVENKQNHVKNLLIHIGELFQNNGILASDHLEIVGDGILENTNRIYAVESMVIKLRNFNNDDGLIESKNSMKLLAVSKEWTRLGGSIKAKKNMDLCANRLNVAIRNVQNLSIDKRLVFSAKTDLLISSDVIDESKELSVGCAAQQSVGIACQMQVDRLEVLLGADSPSSAPTFAVYQNAGIIANTISVTSQCEHVQVLFDGDVQCNRMRFAGNVKMVTIVGSGNLESTYMVLPDASISFEMYSVVRVDELQCNLFQVLNENILRMESCDGEETTTIITEDLNIEGTLFLEKKLFLKSREGVVRINGNILGSSLQSEISCESTKLVVRGQLGNFKYVELFARDSISLQNAKIRNVEKLCVECRELSVYNADIESCRVVSFNCDSLTASGHVQGESRTSFTIHSTNIHSKMVLQNLEKLSIFCKRSSTLKGAWSGIQDIHVDSKWLNISCRVDSCRFMKMTGWAISTCGAISAQNLQIIVLGVLVNSGFLKGAHECHVVATFLISVAEKCEILSEKLKISTLGLFTRDYERGQLLGTNYLWINFTGKLGTLNGASNADLQNYKTYLMMLRDRWMTSSMDADEILLGLKYISDLHEIQWNMSSVGNKVYEGFVELSEKFESSPISLFNYGELVNLVQGCRAIMQLVQDPSNNTKNAKKSKNKSSDCSLYASFVQFKYGKYSKDSNDSSDTDIGYVSRSSSEDLNSKPSRPRSPTLHMDSVTNSFFDPAHLEEIGEKVEKVEEELEKELKLDHIAYAIKEEEELAEFEQLEDELEMAEEGIIRTDIIICRDRSIYLAKLKEKVRKISAPRPVLTVPMQRAPSSNDLVMKKLQVKNAISNLDLRSFGSHCSINSIMDVGTVPDFGSPLQFSNKAAAGFQRSKIPLGSFRSPRTPGNATRPQLSRMGTPTMYGSSQSRLSEKQ